MSKDIKVLQNELVHKTPRDLIHWAKEEFDDHLVMTSAFGASGMVLLDMVREVMPNIPIFFLETGFHFKETLEFIDQVQKEWNLNLIKLYPETSKPDLMKRYGPTPYEHHHNMCCHINKVLPLDKAFKEYQVKGWLTALRKDQSQSREDLTTVEMDNRGIIKVNPIVNWTRKEIWAYIFKNGIPYNPLHDQDYPSIGCEPCTAKVVPGAHERDGRWKGKNKVECGIHVDASIPRESIED